VNRKIFSLVSLIILQAVVSENLVFSAPKKDLSDVRQEVINLDFLLLEKTEQYLNKDESDLTEVPADILALNGKKVKITGYFIIVGEAYYSDKPVTNFAISKSAYGCPCCNWGSPPTIFNTVIVDMQQDESIKPPFTPLVEVTGTFIVKKEQFVDEEGKKRLDALFYIKDAVAKKKKQSFLKNIF
jgi:hypothetical protein